MTQVIETNQKKEIAPFKNKKLALLMERQPQDIIWEYFSDEDVEWWITQAVEQDMYALAEIFKKEKQKRNK